MSFRILITGTSVAGNTVTCWISRAGLYITLVERLYRRLVSVRPHPQRWLSQREVRA